jgi:hypothetical protein
METLSSSEHAMCAVWRGVMHCGDVASAAAAAAAGSAQPGSLLRWVQQAELRECA